MPATKEQRLAKLEAELDKLSKKEKEGDWHKLQRRTSHHDKLTAVQKKMNELERKIRLLKGESGGRRTRRHRRTRHTRRR
jgi:hypothetical protein